MIYILIAAGSEVAALALAAAVREAVPQNLSTGRLQIGLPLNSARQLSAAGAALYTSLVAAGYVAIPVAGSTSSVYQLATTVPDAAKLLFYFPSKVGLLIGMYLGGVIQLPADCSVTVDGGVQLASYVPPPSLPVTAQFIPAAS